MSFEILEHDLHARLGRLQTPHGVVRTPALAPVVNPKRSPFPIQALEAEFGCELIITNAYLIFKYYGEGAAAQGLHRLLGFGRTIMTDSGAYQILEYGYIEISPDFILDYQRKIGSDIMVILDVPSGALHRHYTLSWSLKETLRRALRATLTYPPEERESLLVGPIQGGTDPGLVAASARRLARLDFDIYALGSPTQLMENYRFDILVDLMAAARAHIPISKPMHLFGAGHPMMFALAVALGFDLFDSASYILYARDDRYLTPHRTIRLESLSELPCNCPVCRSLDASELKEMPKHQREALLAKHNLYVMLNELRLIRQAIEEGTLMRLLESRCRSHPSLYQAFIKLRKYVRLLERADPITKPDVRGIFIFDAVSASVSPKVHRHWSRLRELPPRRGLSVILLPEPECRPYSDDPRVHRLIMMLERGRLLAERLDVVFYTRAFGPVPLELCETYPLSQHEISFLGFDEAAQLHLASSIADFVVRRGYSSALIVVQEDWPPGFFRELLARLDERGVKARLTSFEKLMNEICGDTALALDI